jgi:hypothetical protein
MILRNVTDEDLPIFFEHQRDPEALRMAAFSSRERDAFMTHWRTKVLRPENVSRVLEKFGFHTMLNENQHHPGGVAEVLMRLGSGPTV